MKINKFILGLILFCSISMTIFANGNDPSKPIKNNTPLERVTIVSYDVEVSIFRNTGDEVSETPIVARRQVTSTYFPDGRYENRYKKLQPESELSNSLRESSKEMEGEVENTDLEYGEIVSTEESTKVFDSNGRVIDEQATDDKEREDIKTSILEGTIIMTCQKFKEWIETIKDTGCTIEESGEKGKFCMTCKNPDGTVTVTVIDVTSNTIRSISEIDEKGNITSIVAYETECNGIFPTPKSTVEKFFSYEDGRTTTTTVVTKYNSYEVTEK